MEKETFDFIGGILVFVLMISGIGLGFYGLHTMSRLKKEKNAVGGIALPVGMKYTPHDKPFGKLWNESGASVFFDMDGANHGKLIINSIQEGNKLPLEYDNEEVYRDAILELMKDGLRYRKLNINNPELRKFCIINTNNCATMENRIKNANVLYDYINKGFNIKNKEA